MEGKIKRVLEGGKRRKEYISTKSALQEMLKGLLLEEGQTGRERERNKGTKRKMTMNKYLIIITLNVNRLSAPIKGIGQLS